jgi:hypothetical protein
MSKLKWSYKKAIEFIALNDKPEIYDETYIQDMTSVITLSIASGKSKEDITKDIIKLRTSLKNY